MWTAVKTALVILAMVAIIPLMIWAGSGSWRHAAHAVKEYLLYMAVIVVPVTVLALVVTGCEIIIAR